MIIWLASYPKSGNTLLRSILSTYFFSDDGIFSFEHLYKIAQFPSNEFFKGIVNDIKNQDEISKKYIDAQIHINKKSKSIKFLKTHSALAKIGNKDFTDFNNTMGAIYVVRDPRNVVASVAYHFNLGIGDATSFLLENRNWLKENEQLPRTFISSWKINYNSWKIFNEKLLIIKYEDLIFEKKNTILKIFDFFQSLGMHKSKIDLLKLDKVIETTEFKKMKSLEQKNNFSESVKDFNKKNKSFFNLGPANDWKTKLELNLKSKIENAFNKEMKELGYL